jgi:hypothetical protein
VRTNLHRRQDVLALLVEILDLPIEDDVDGRRAVGVRHTQPDFMPADAARKMPAVNRALDRSTETLSVWWKVRHEFRNGNPEKVEGRLSQG